MVWNIVLMALIVVQILGMRWAWTEIRSGGDGGAGPMWYEALLVIFWPVTWIVSRIGMVE